MSPLAVLSGAPLWVWPLFVTLVVLGWRASRTRSVPVLLVYALPALGLTTISTLVRLPEPMLVFGAHLAGYLAGAAAGFAVQRRWILERRGGTARLAGDWLTLAMMMTLFAAGFVNGAVAAAAPGLHASPVFLGAFALLTGMASGTFGGRAARLAATPATA